MDNLLECSHCKQWVLRPWWIGKWILGCDECGFFRPPTNDELWDIIRRKGFL